MAVREVPVAGLQQAGQWVGVMRPGGAYVVKSSSADGRGVTPLQGRIFRGFACSTC